MELLEIREIFNQKIAIINVTEARDNKGLYPWNSGYFQGSTEKLLPYVETFDWKIRIRNPEIFVSELEAYDQELYQQLMTTDYTELSVTFRAFSSWLYVKFIEREE